MVAGVPSVLPAPRGRAPGAAGAARRRALDLACVKVKVKVKCIYMGTYQLFPAPVLTKSIQSVLF